MAKFNPQTALPKTASLRRALAAWFGKNARDLPWRRTRDPYAILVSEFMLQQTQVATVIPYYTRWLARFPDFTTLAVADETAVLSLWQGLGYYSRARNLHRAARAVADGHGGTLPADPAAIRALPGVGRYTAGAVASFAFDLPEPAVDANIARVLARLLDLHEPLDTASAQSALWSAAAHLLPARGAGKFNASLMELGAILCSPRNPRCGACPIRTHCRAHTAGTAAALPKKKARRSSIALDEPCAWVLRSGRILLAQQTGPRWRGLWKLPPHPAPPRTPPLHALEYPFTHHRITLRIFPGRAPAQPPPGHAWHPLEALAALPLAAPHRRAIEHLLACS